MTVQKSKTVIAATAAVVLVLLLGGASFVFFPIEAPTKTSAILNCFVPTSLALTPPLYYYVTNSTNSYVSLNPTGNAFNVWFAPTQPGIAIEKDGSINSTAAPIQRSGDTYALTGNLDNRTLIIKKSNIILNGGGYTVEGFSNGFDYYAYEAIDLQGVTNVTVENFNVDSFWQPIQVHDSSRVRIEANNITNCPSYAIKLDSCNYTVVANNFSEGTIAIDHDYGEAVSTCNSIINNTLVDMAEGIQIYDGSHNTVSGNNLTNVYDDIGIAGNSSVISNNIIVNGIDGIFAGQGTIIRGNVVFNVTDVGIGVGGQNNRIYANTVEDAKYGVSLMGNSSADLKDTIFYGNNFVNNTQNLQTDPSVTVQWDNAKEGNYWSSYNGTDRNGDGVGDTPYNISGDNTDFYPLMQPTAAAQTAAADSSMGQLFFAFAAIAGAAGLIISVCLYVRSLKTPAKNQAQQLSGTDKN